MAAYYNEIDPFAVAWLRNLIAAGLIPDGEVDERSILDVRAADLRPFRQHHFFAGIGGWPHALDLAGWARDRPVWTGSPPCQPLSSAGQRRAHADERHLWPAFYELVAECRPATLFGEQVASKLGREWFSGVRADLEHLGFAVGGADLPAACVGAPHIRQRLYWVANAEEMRRSGRPTGLRREAWGGTAGGGSGLADTQRDDRGADLAERRPQGRALDFWADTVWLQCLDGKTRRIEPTIQPLATGLRNRVGMLRGSGNSIVPQAAAVFISAVMEVL